MKRIGVAASKISRGNLFLYNFYVILISILFSAFIFFMAGSAVILALIVISRIVEGIIPKGFSGEWSLVLLACMISLAVVVGIFNLMAISTNIKLPGKK